MKIKIHHKDYGVMSSRSLTDEEVIDVLKLTSELNTILRFPDENDPKIIWIIPEDILKQSIIKFILEDKDL